MNAIKLTIIGLAQFISFTCSFAQGSFALNNLYGGVDAPVFDAQNITLAGTNFLAELWGAGNPNSLAPARVVEPGLRREIISFRGNGYFSSGEGLLSILDIPAGGFAWLQVRAWDARLGATYEQVAAMGVGGYGESVLFYAQGGNPTTPTLPAPLLGLQSFNLRPYVPEPSGLSLLLLGGAAGWWARKKWR